MRALTILIMGVWSLVLTGCSSGTTPPTRPAPQAASQPVQVQRPQSTALLFDSGPGYWRASDFAVRSDWPATDAYYEVGQTIYFRERFYDYQGPGVRHPDHTYRRFTTYRTGVAYR